MNHNTPDVIYAFFGLGPLEIGIIVVVALVIFGPKRLPGLGSSMGEAIKGFKKGLSDDEEIDVTDSAKKEELDKESYKEAQTQKETEKEHDKA